MLEQFNVCDPTDILAETMNNQETFLKFFPIKLE